MEARHRRRSAGSSSKPPAAKGTTHRLRPDTFWGRARRETARRMRGAGADKRPIGGAACSGVRVASTGCPIPASTTSAAAARCWTWARGYVTDLVDLLGPIASVTGVATAHEAEHVVTSKPLRASARPHQVSTADPPGVASVRPRGGGLDDVGLDVRAARARAYRGLRRGPLPTWCRSPTCRRRGLATSWRGLVQDVNAQGPAPGASWLILEHRRDMAQAICTDRPRPRRPASWRPCAGGRRGLSRRGAARSRRSPSPSRPPSRGAAAWRGSWRTRWTVRGQARLTR